MPKKVCSIILIKSLRCIKIYHNEFSITHIKVFSKNFIKHFIPFYPHHMRMLYFLFTFLIMELNNNIVDKTIRRIMECIINFLGLSSNFLN